MVHPDPDLIAALVLEPADVDAEVRLHVDDCAECGALRSALAQTLGTATAAGDEEWVAPPPHLKERVMAQVSAPSREATRTPGAAVTDLSSRRRVPWWTVGLAAAVALLAGWGLGRFTAPGDAEPPDPGQVVAAASLTSLEDSADRGEATAVRHDDVVVLQISARELGEDSGIHEVWLLNVDGTRMVSVGLLAAGDTGEFEVPQRLLEEGYRIVDISVEPDDGDPAHSGVSLARGELA
jgi:hypothetical protein